MKILPTATSEKFKPINWFHMWGMITSKTLYKKVHETKSAHGSYSKKWKIKALFQYHVRACQSFHDFSQVLSTYHAVLICELLIICSADAEFLLTVIYSQAWGRIPELTCTFQKLPSLLYCDTSHPTSSCWSLPMMTGERECITMRKRLRKHSLFHHN